MSWGGVLGHGQVPGGYLDQEGQVVLDLVFVPVLHHGQVCPLPAQSSHVMPVVLEEGTGHVMAIEITPGWAGKIT